MKFVMSQFAFFLTEAELRRNVKALVKYFAFLVVLIVVYSVLFHLIMMNVEGQQHSWVTGLYWTLTVMSTLGFGDITFATDLGRVFSIVVLLSGILLLLVMLPFLFIRFFYAPWLEARVKMRTPREIPRDMRHHVVICSWESIAPRLIDRLRQHLIPYVVIEPDPVQAARMYEDRINVVLGDLDAEETYRKVHVERARLVFANSDDPTNTNITLTVREIAAEVPISAIASFPESEDVIELAGATHVLPLPRRLGEHLANRVNAGHARSHVIGRYHDLLVAEFPVHDTPLVGRTIRQTRLRQATQVSIVGVWERGRLLPANPDHVLTPTSVPVVVGNEKQIGALDEFLVIYDTNENPVLVVGGGKVGRAAARILRSQGIAVHLIEKNIALRDRIGDVANQVFFGDAADRDILEAAGLADAPSVLLTTHDDAMNIYLAVYCRRLKPDVRLISRVTHQKNLDAVLRAGADFVLSYASLGADFVMATLLGNDLVVLGEGIDVIHALVPRALAGRTLEESGIGARTGLTVIAVHDNGRIITNLRPSHRLNAGANLIMIGSVDQRFALDSVLRG
jgi:voltage-gated potassium channel